MNECSIGYLRGEEGLYAGKNWEPGLEYSVIAITSAAVTDPSYTEIGLIPGEDLNLEDEIRQSAQNERIYPLEDLDIELFESYQGESLPERMETSHRSGYEEISGLIPSKHVGSKPEDPLQSVFILPSDTTAVGVASHHNLDEWWCGLNSSGLYFSTSALKHYGRSDMKPYSVLSKEVLMSSSEVEEGEEYLHNRLMSSNFKGVNFLLADRHDQSITEYLPQKALDSENPAIEVTRDRESDFRSNLGKELGFYLSSDWEPQSAERKEIHDFVRSINRQIALEETAGRLGVEVFKDHTFYPELLEPETMSEAKERLEQNNLDSTDLNKEQRPSFYTTCSHPQQIPLTDDENPSSSKKTFVTSIADLEDELMKIIFDNPCKAGGAIETDIGKLDEVLEEQV